MSLPGQSTIIETRRAQIFPQLDWRQLAELRPYGEVRTFPAGATLWGEGDRHVPMFVVLKGGLDIYRPTGAEQEELVTTHGPGVFSGEVSMLGGRGSLVRGRTTEDSEMLVVDEAALRRLMVSHAELSEIVMRAFILRRVAMLDVQTGGMTLIGSRLVSDTHRLRQFLTRNGQPHTYLDLERDAETATWLQRLGITAEDLPVAILRDGRVLRSPSNSDLADAIGLSPEKLDGREFDVAVIGAGPAGLAAAVYAASEGLSVVVLDAKAPGGQAGTSSRIENYLGFPTGISGQALAGRGFNQAQKFGAEVAIPREIVRFECRGAAAPAIALDNGERITARSVVVATGARYRKPDLPDLDRFEGRGIYYGASFMESQLCGGQEIIVVGGGNSAGQAAVFLARYVNRVHMLVRSNGLAASMSDYLIRRITATPTITLRTETEIVGLHGDGALEGVRWRHSGSDVVEDRPIHHVFLFLGADPNTAWLGGCLALDAAGFIKTGRDLTPDDLTFAEWPLHRQPLRLETSHPGIFAVGDVRSGSVKRVAAAVGEGSSAVQLIHSCIAEQHNELTGHA
ncbi:MAG: FAD-dependent oxidoreductase [bacterium]